MELETPMNPGGMKYFTAAEATRIIQETPLTLVSGYADNPNSEAMLSLLKVIQKYQSSTQDAACLGFVLGHATGKREERARRKEHLHG